MQSCHLKILLIEFDSKLSQWNINIFALKNMAQIFLNCLFVLLAANVSWFKFVEKLRLRKYSLNKSYWPRTLCTETFLTLKNFTFAKINLVYIWKVVVCTAKLWYFRCSPDVISTASSGLLPIDVPKIKVHHFRCSKAVEIWRVQQMAVNFTAFCQIVAFILKVVFSITISHRKYDF